MGFIVELKRGTPCVPVTRESFEGILRDKRQNADIRFIRQRLEDSRKALEAGLKDKAKELKAEADKRKSFLPGFVFQCQDIDEHEWIDSKKVNHGMGKWRNNEHARLNGLFMCDFDHVGDPHKAWDDIVYRLCKNQNAKLKDFGILFAYVTPSGEGIKTVHVADPEVGNLRANQERFSKLVGLECDEKCKDAARLSFASTWDDILFLSDELFTYQNLEYGRKFDVQYNTNMREPKLFSQGGSGEKEDASAQAAATQENAELYESYRYKGKKVGDIIEAWLAIAPPMEGERHDTLMNLVSELRHVCDRKNDLLKYHVKNCQFVQDLMKEGDAVDKDIEDALNFKYTTYMPKRMQKAINSLADDRKEVEKIRNAETFDRFVEWGRRLQELSRYYPCLKELFDEGRPELNAPALFVAGAMFGTLATKTWYYFYHLPEVRRRLNYGIFIIGDPTSGKSFANRLYKIIMEPIIVADKVGNDRINAWKDDARKRDKSDKNRKAEALEYPKDKIRIHGTRTANGVFIEDMVNNHVVVDGEDLHIHLFTFDSELDAATSNSKGGQWIDKSVFELKAFHNEEDNQQYRNIDAVNGPFNVYWNYIYTGTPLSLNRKITERNFGSGLFGRLACIPLLAERYEMIPFTMQTKKNEESIERLKEWAYRLDKVGGELPIWDLVRETWEWCNLQMKMAEIDDDPVRALLAKRVPYYGINIAVPFIIMRNWALWEKERKLNTDDHDRDFVNLIMDIQFYCQNLYFAKYAEIYFDNKLNDETNRGNRHYSKTVSFYNSLPKQFTFDEIDAKTGNRNTSCSMVKAWVREGYLKKTGRGSRAIFVKTKDMLE